MPDLGRIFRVRSWDDNGGIGPRGWYRLTFALGRRKPNRVVLMLCLGEMDRGGPVTRADLLDRLAMIGFVSNGEATVEVESSDHP